MYEKEIIINIHSEIGKENIVSIQHKLDWSDKLTGQVLRIIKTSISQLQEPTVKAYYKSIDTYRDVCFNHFQDKNKRIFENTVKQFSELPWYKRLFFKPKYINYD